MRRVILIDGENLMYALRGLLGVPGKRADRVVLEGFNFRGLLNDVLEDDIPAEVLWYGAQLHIYDNSEEVKLRSESAVRGQAHFINEMQRQKITFVKGGTLRVRKVELASGDVTWKLVEKGVDVGLAVRIVAEASPGTELVIVSADTDLLPAFKAANKLGARLIHVGYQHRQIASLSSVSHETRTITFPLAERHRKKQKILLPA